ncbi:addiction module antidote protein [Mesorhizobium sp. ZC-5]|uniref:addiction module antidote protein n=1 Tax=Mesorhizobium sp. ZC-5 TaxID=2986066 RepID=UPI0021E7C650|nr:addiction module antidote protein [Mesorhizobium sp. ZC-5]MCV3243550.1 putative addiction module antidote protein [Mesorhizobium sp. ZC-5]
MAIETVPFDASEFLGSVESQAELLADAFESGDAGYITHTLGVVARARGMTGIAKEAGVTREALYKALSGDGDPKLTTLLGVLRALDMKITTKPAKTRLIA